MIGAGESRQLASRSLGNCIPQLTVSLRIPADLSVIGGTLAMQGLSIGSGTCFSALSLSDTIQFTIR